LLVLKFAANLNAVPAATKAVNVVAVRLRNSPRDDPQVSLAMYTVENAVVAEAVPAMTAAIADGVRKNESKSLTPNS
jgi:hypothetical protein